MDRVITDFNLLQKEISGEMPNLIMFKGMIGSILMQRFQRNINGDKILFGIWNIDINPEFRRQKYFTSLIEGLEKTDYHVCVNDIVNKNVEKFLLNRGWYFKNFSKPGHGEVLMSYLLKDH